MKRPVLIFDFGNVVAHFDYAVSFGRLGAPRGVSGFDLLENARRLGLGALLEVYEAGGVSSEGFSQSVRDRLGLTIGHEEFATAWADIFVLNPSVASLVEQLKKRGYTLVLGSNTNEMHATHFLKQFAETFGRFDRLVLSYQVGAIKPASAFYEACSRSVGAEPSDCVFIDDLPANVEGARQAGLQGLVYTDTARLKEDLRLLGVEV